MFMTMQPMNGCPIWPHFTAQMRLVDESGELHHFESHRTGGEYEIHVSAVDLLEGLDAGPRARLTTWLVDQRSLGVRAPRVTQQIVEYATTKRPLSVPERAERLLKYVGLQIKAVGAYHKIWRHEPEICATFCAWSESIEWDPEVNFLLTFLFEQNWLQGVSDEVGNISCTVTMAGYRRLAEQATDVDARQAFVAMWFDDSVNEAYDNGIRPAVEAAGYSPLRIDLKPDADKIDDEIIAEIRRSRFLVADFTHGDQGARGGVYFEAGFAFGLGIPVIFTCRDDMVAKLHFDTRQYAHIVWNSTEQLRDQLKNRILARIGEGSGVDPAERFRQGHELKTN